MGRRQSCGLALTKEICDDEEAKARRLTQLLDERRGQRIIVYTHRKVSETWGTKALAGRYRALDHATAHFDGDLTVEERKQVVADFEAGVRTVVLTTSRGRFGAPCMRGG
jgi:superfamily II DNA/RNA helicase